MRDTCMYAVQPVILSVVIIVIEKRLPVSRSNRLQVPVCTKNVRRDTAYKLNRQSKG
jgi:hypothetical protein